MEKQVGRRIRRLREQRSLSQSELGRMAKFGEARQSTMAKLEAGQRPLRLNEVAAIAAALQVPLSVLVQVSPSQDRARAADDLADAVSRLQGAILAREEAASALDRAERSIVRLQAAVERAERRLREIDEQELATVTAERQVTDGQHREEA